MIKKEIITDRDQDIIQEIDPVEEDEQEPEEMIA